MKFKSIFHTSLVFAFSSICYGVQYIGFPASGTEDTAVTTGWTIAEGGPMGDRKAWYDTIGSNRAVSVGAFYDDYADTGGAFSIDHAISPTVALTDSALLWNFTITDFDEVAIRNDYSFSLLNSSNVNLVTVNFKNAPGVGFWNVSINGGSAFTAVEEDGNYLLSLTFSANGANADYLASIGAFSTTGSITGGATASIGHARIGASLGTGNTEFGDGFITVVPEPGTTMLVSLLPAFCILRRRR